MFFNSPNMRLAVALIFIFFIAALLLYIDGSFVTRASEPRTRENPMGMGRINGANPGSGRATKVNFQDARRLDIRGIDSLDGIDLAGADPRALATDDLNADGFPDLVCSYSIPGGGFLIVYYGSESAFAPKDPAELKNIVENRFPAPFDRFSVIRLGTAPDFLLTGDFDRDNRNDILTATDGGELVSVLINVGDGSFDERSMVVPGQISAIAAGEKNKSDGYADLIVGIRATDNPHLLVYERPDSILAQSPLAYRLPAAADSITLGRLDNDNTMDIAVVADQRVVILHGGAEAAAEMLELPFAVGEVAVGDFIWDRDGRIELAAAGDDGSVRILSRGDLDTTPYSDDELKRQRQLFADIRDGRIADPARTRDAREEWKVAESAGISLKREGAQPLLMPVLASGESSVDLLTLDPVGRGISISSRTGGPHGRVALREKTEFQSELDPVAVLPMRLNIHSRPSLVVLQKGSIEPALMFVAPSAVFTVTKTADTNDGTCNADCSLREAVVAANASLGLDTINFAAGLNGSPIQLTRIGDDSTAANGDLDINDDVTITGSGTANTIIQGSSNASFTGNMGDKVFGINQDGTHTTLNVTITDLTVRFTRNDLAVNGNFSQTGGATDIFLTGTGAVPGPTTTLTNVTYDSNAVLHSYGGGINIDSGGTGGTGVHRGNVQITGSTFSNNDTLSTTLGDNPPAGGAFNLFSDRHNVTISSSAISNNQTSADIRSNGGGINIRHSNGGTITINSGTTVTGNTAGSDGGGILIAGVGGQTFSMTGGSISSNTAQGTGDSGDAGGFFNANNVGSSSLSGVTISNNIATAGTSGRGGGIIDGANTPLSIDNCTITGNSADVGGGMAVTNVGGTQTATLSNGTSISGNTATTSGSGMHVSSGIAAFSNTIAVTNDIVIAGGTLVGNTGSTVTLNGNFSESSGTFTGNNSTFNITGNFTYTGGMFTAGTGTFNFNGSGAQSISNSSSITFTNLSDANVTQPLTLNNSFNVNGTLTANGGATVLNPAAAIVIGGTGTLTGTGTARVTRTAATAGFLNQYTITNKTLTNLLVDYVGGAAQVLSATTYGPLRINNGSGVTLSTGTASVDGTLTLTAGALLAGAGTTLNINNGTSVAAGTIGGATTSTVNYGQGSAGQVVLAGNYGNLTFSNFNKTLPASTVGIAGTFTPGSGTPTVTGNTINFNGSALQTIPVFPYNNLQLNNAAGANLGGNVTVNGALTLTSGALGVGTNTLILNGASGATGGSLTSAATGTVNYNQGTNGQSVLNANYGNLTFSNFDKSLPTAFVGIAGVFTPGSGTPSVVGNVIVFNGTSAQAIPVFPYAGLALNNAAGATLAGNTTVTESLTLTAGVLTTGAGNTLTMDTGATTARTSGYVTGNLRKNYGGPGAFIFMVGTASGYAPVDSNVTAGTGNLTVTPVQGAMPPLSAAVSLARYWTLAGTGITTNLVFHYNQSDVNGNENNYRIHRKNGAVTVSLPNACPTTTCVDPAANTGTVSGVSSFSDWTMAEFAPPTAAGVSVAGRVTAPDGRGISGARVVLQDPEGNVLAAQTNAFGYYSFDSVQAGRSYTVSVASKTYMFVPRVVTVGDELTDLDFIGVPRSN